MASKRGRADSERQTITRRRFLESGMGTAVGLASSHSALSGGWIGAQPVRKPPLSESAINARIPPPNRTQELQNMANSVKSDLVKYVRENFEVSEMQLKQLQTLSVESRQTLNSAIDKAMKEHLKINVKAGCQQPSRKANASATGDRMVPLSVKTHFTQSELVINFENAG